MLETKIHPFFQRFPYPAWIEIILPAGVGEIDGVGPELLGLLLPDGEGLDEGELVGELEDGEPPANNKGLKILDSNRVNFLTFVEQIVYDPPNVLESTLFFRDSLIQHGLK